MLHVTPQGPSVSETSNPTDQRRRPGVGTIERGLGARFAARCNFEPSPIFQLTRTALSAKISKRPEFPPMFFRRGTISRRRIASRARYMASHPAARSPVVASSQFNLADRNVSSDVGSGIASRLCGSSNSGNFANSALRPFRTASASSGSKCCKERKRLRGGKLLTHEEHGDLGKQQIDRNDCPQRFGRRD